jgi:O-antigen ligase
MRRKREDKSKASHSQREAEPFARKFPWERAFLALATCLLVATPLIPSEATVRDGTAALLVALWLLALVLWAVWQVANPQPRLVGGWTMLALGVFVALHTLSALTLGTQGNARQALNVLWLFVLYGTATFLLRQLLHNKVECRALVAVMIGLAAVETTSGYYDYFVSGPERRAAFQKDPELMYRQMGAVSPTHRDQLRWRIESVEPTATFALTNSLAGLLAPWLIALAGVTLALLQQGRWRTAALATPLLAAMAGCLLLTKSRTALLAAAGGVTLLLLYGRSRGWRLDWKIPTLAGAVLVVLGLVAVVVGGLDAQVLSQAPQSVLYRLQYWQSTAAMIADYPLFGCGPGNFKEHYARYQLPQASETVSDPHNFLLEIWATTGTPALIAFLAVAAAFVWELSRAKREPASHQPSGDAVTSSHSHSRGWVYGGALAGLILAFPLALVANFPPDLLSVGGEPILPVIWVLGLPIAALAAWILDAWVVAGEMPTAVPVISLVVLLTNLLAAGAATFPGVFGSAWLLVPLALVHAGGQPPWWKMSRSGALAGILAALLLLGCCIYTEYSPVLRASVELEQGQRLASEGHLGEADQTLLRAAGQDPWSPEPWRALADVRLQVWLRTQEAVDWERFVLAVDQFIRRDSRHFQPYESKGNWYLTAWRRSDRATDLAIAVEGYREATGWHPSRAQQHAQLAWALHLAGQDQEARAQAEAALRLDGLNPHTEQKLAKQAIFNPSSGSGGQAAYRPENAEQTMEQLRKSIGPEKQP